MEEEVTGQKKKDKKTNNDLQNSTQKTKDRATRTKLKAGGELSSCNCLFVFSDYQMINVIQYLQI